MTYYSVNNYPTSTQLPGLMFPIIRTPEWDTDVQIAVSGRRTAFARRAYPRYKYELSYSVLRTSTSHAEWQTLASFYDMMNGRAGVFAYTDQDDNSVTAQSFGTGDSTTQTFQLVRSQTGVSPYGFIEPVFAVNTASIFVGGTLSTFWGIGNTGIVSFGSTNIPPNGQALTWTGTYAWYCRFDEDVNQFEKFLYNTYEIKKVKFSSELF